MKVVTWNVNSLNVRLEHVIDWIKSNKPDILCIQETKQTNEKFAHDAFLMRVKEVSAGNQQAFFYDSSSDTGVVAGD